MEHNLTFQSILVAYTFFNAFRLLAYIPQIIALAKEESAAKAISLITYWMWVGANFTTALYATVIMPDIWLASVSYINSGLCLAVSLMIHYKRRKYAEKTPLVSGLATVTTGI